MPLVTLTETVKGRLVFVAVLLLAGAGTFVVGRGMLDRPTAGGGRVLDGAATGGTAPPPPPASFEIAPSPSPPDLHARRRTPPPTAAGASKPVVFAFAGRVSDEDQAAIVGADVVLSYEIGLYRGMVSDPPRVAAAKTDDDGRFLIEGLTGSERYAVVVRHPEYATSQVRNIEAAVSTTLARDFTLTRGRAISGVVRSEGGAGSGARVQVIDLGRPTRDGLGTIEREVPTDAAGRFNAGFLAQGAKAVVVTAPGFVPSRVEPVGVRPNVDSVLEIKLFAGKPLRGVVLRDTADGRTEAVGGAKIVARIVGPAAGAAAPPASFPSAETTTGGGGAFVFDALPDALYVLWVSTEDSDPVPATIDPEPDAGPSAPPPSPRPGGDPLVVRLPTPTTGALAGRTFDVESSTNLRRFFVWASRVNDPNALAVGRRFVDSAVGTFVVGGLPPGSWFVFVEGEGLPPTPAGPFEVVVGERRTGCDVPTTPGVVVTGRVIDDAGLPVVGAAVAARSPYRPERMVPGVEISFAPPDARAVAAPGQGFTAVDGSFEIRVARGGWKFVVTHAETIEFATDPYHCGGEVKTGDLVVKRAGRLVGVVQDAYGAAEAGATVAVIPDGATERTAWRGAMTSADGSYELRNLKSGNYWIGVTQRGGRNLVGTPEGALQLIFVGGGESVRKDF